MSPGAVPAHSIVLGTMRMHEKGLSEADSARLLALAWDRGVRRLHSSSEYDSFPFFRAVLGRLVADRPDIAFGHVVKLAEPSFGEQAFDPARFRRRLVDYAGALATGRIETVQWMWRASLDDDARRIGDFCTVKKTIAATAADLRAGGLLGELGCFPYTREFAAAAVDSGAFDGLIVYANAFEPEYAPEIARARNTGLFVDIIRPFAQGRALKESATPAVEVLAKVLSQTGARSAILSVSSRAQLDAVLPPP